MRAQEEINKEIEKLELLKRGIPQRSSLGTDNHKIIEYQIAVLKGEYDEDDINEMTCFEDEEDFGDKELNQDESSSILEAFEFLNGGIDELVSEEDLEVWSKK